MKKGKVTRSKFLTTLGVVVLVTSSFGVVKLLSGCGTGPGEGTGSFSDSDPARVDSSPGDDLAGVEVLSESDLEGVWEGVLSRTVNGAARASLELSVYVELDAEGNVIDYRESGIEDSYSLEPGAPSRLLKIADDGGFSMVVYSVSPESSDVTSINRFVGKLASDKATFYGTAYLGCDSEDEAWGADVYDSSLSRISATSTEADAGTYDNDSDSDSEDNQTSPESIEVEAGSTDNDSDSDSEEDNDSDSDSEGDEESEEA